MRALDEVYMAIARLEIARDASIERFAKMEAALNRLTEDSGQLAAANDRLAARLEALQRSRPPEQPAPLSKAGEAAHGLRRLAENPYQPRLTADDCREIARMLEAAEKALVAYSSGCGTFGLDDDKIHAIGRAKALFSPEPTP